MDLVCRSADDVDECWRRERWRLEVGVLRGVISSRDHERRTFHGPSLTSNNRPNHSSLFFFRTSSTLRTSFLLTNCSSAITLLSQIIIRTSLFSFHNQVYKFTSARLLFIRQHSVSVLSLSINIVSPNFLSSFFLSGLLHPQSTITQVHTYSTFRAYFILYR